MAIKRDRWKVEISFLKKIFGWGISMNHLGWGDQIERKIIIRGVQEKIIVLIPSLNLEIQISKKSCVLIFSKIMLLYF